MPPAAALLSALLQLSEGVEQNMSDMSELKRLADEVAAMRQQLAQLLQARGADDPELASAGKAMTLFNISRSTWWEWVRTGRAPQPVKVNGLTRWRMADLLPLLPATEPTTASSPDAAPGTAPGGTPPAPRRSPSARAAARSRPEESGRPR